MESKPAAAEKHGFDGQGWATAITIIIGQPGYNMAPTENWEVSSVLLSSSHILALHTQGGNLVKGKKAKKLNSTLLSNVLLNFVIKCVYKC